MPCRAVLVLVKCGRWWTTRTYIPPLTLAPDLFYHLCTLLTTVDSIPPLTQQVHNYFSLFYYYFYFLFLHSLIHYHNLWQYFFLYLYLSILITPYLGMFTKVSRFCEYSVRRNGDEWSLKKREMEDDASIVLQQLFRLLSVTKAGPCLIANTGILLA